MRLRSSSLEMSCLAIALVWSGVSRCLVSGTSLPSIRARKTSPALMCRSDAPRSTAALMIFSIGFRHSKGWARDGSWSAKKPHAIPHLPHGLGSHTTGCGGPSGEDLVHPLRLLPKPESPFSDGFEGGNHIIGQHPLAVEAPPLGPPAVLRHLGHRLGWGEV